MGPHEIIWLSPTFGQARFQSYFMCMRETERLCTCPRLQRGATESERRVESRTTFEYNDLPAAKNQSKVWFLSYLFPTGALGFAFHNEGMIPLLAF